MDCLDYGAYFELYLLTGDEAHLDALKALTRGRNHAFITLAKDYLSFGCAREALLVSELMDQAYALRHYAAGLAYFRLGEEEEAAAAWARAEGSSVHDCNVADFSYQDLLHAPMRAGVPCAKAHYLMGNLYYARGNVDEACANWAQADKAGLMSAALHRNMALALFEKLGDRAGARREMERAFALDRQDPRLLLELELLYKALCVAPLERLLLMEAYAGLLPRRCDLYVEYVSLLNLCGREKEALSCLQRHVFHTYEGGEGLLPREHLLTHVLLGRAAEQRGELEEALRLYRQALIYPGNYHEGRKNLVREGHLHYHIARVLAALGRAQEAQDTYRLCTVYPEDLDETECYKALALRALGDEPGAARVLRGMIDRAESVLGGSRRFDYFGGFPTGMPFHQDMERITTMKCLLAIAYACLALGDAAGVDAACAKLAALSVDTPWLPMIRSDIV